MTEQRGPARRRRRRAGARSRTTPSPARRARRRVRPARRRAAVRAAAADRLAGGPRRLRPPAGAGAFAPPPGERIAPRPHRAAAGAARARRVPSARRPRPRDGFDPRPGTRIDPRAARPNRRGGSPTPPRPWRDPAAPFWLGRGAVFTGGRPRSSTPTRTPSTDDEPRVRRADDEPEDVEPERAGCGGPVRAAAPIVLLVVALVAGAVGGGVGTGWSPSTATPCTAGRRRWPRPARRPTGRRARSPASPSGSARRSCRSR